MNFYLYQYFSYIGGEFIAKLELRNSKHCYLMTPNFRLSNLSTLGRYDYWKYGVKQKNDDVSG